MFAIERGIEKATVAVGECTPSRSSCEF
jgi:hypothetical protein